MEIRILGPGDDHILENCAIGVFDDPIVSGSTREFLADPRHHLAVAIDGGMVVGFASAVHYLHPDKELPELWVNEIGVAPTYRRRGLGTQLIRALFAVGREIGCREGWVLTERTNLPAMGLYSALGGVEAPADPVMFTLLLDDTPTD